MNITRGQLKELDNLVEKKLYRFRSEAVRDAILLLLRSRKSAQLRNILNRLKEKEKPIRISPEIITRKIIEVLAKHPNGLDINQISEILSVHRHTIRKYAAELISKKLVLQSKVGTSKICFLKTRRIKK